MFLALRGQRTPASSSGLPVFRWPSDSGALRVLESLWATGRFPTYTRVGISVETDTQLALQITRESELPCTVIAYESWKPDTNLKNELCMMGGMWRWKMLSNVEGLGK